MHELTPLIRTLAVHRPHRLRLRRWVKRAAVAVILRETRQGAEVLLVERAQRPGDPWSGDMALPGGRVDDNDKFSASAAACRETGEEIGLALTRAHGVGRLSDRLSLDHRRRAPMVISPFVYRCPGSAALTFNHEITASRWVALAWLDEPARRGTLHWRLGPIQLPMPSYECGRQRRLWGLTLLMLDELVRIARRQP